MSGSLNDHKEYTLKSLKRSSRLSVFATIRRRTSQIFTHNKEPVASTDQQDQEIWRQPRLGKRQSWFNSVKMARHIHHGHREDYCSDDARTDLDDLVATFTATTNTSTRSPAKRLLRASSSMFLSLRGARHNQANTVYHRDEEEQEQHDNRSTMTIRRHSFERSTPSVDLTLPVVCSNSDLSDGHRRSSFQLGVQKAVQDKVDQNFSLDEEVSDAEPNLSPKRSNKRPSLHIDTISSDGNAMHPHTVCSTRMWSPVKSSSSKSTVRDSGSEENCARTTSPDSTVQGTPSPKTRVEVELTHEQLRLLRTEEIKALIKDKTGALELIDRERLIWSFEGTGRGQWGRRQDRGERVSSEYDDGFVPAHHIHHSEDDRTTLSVSILEGDSGLFASTPKLQHSRSLRDELLQVGEMSQICEGNSVGVEF
ncbi:hypothetical protein QBC43DRAFT_362401 [Cladorrhinum sp. PSN259]|nr:hypothetical protein QBC43DRAFT_362401 [Cladorrhinum sp. PSN259]